MQTRLNNPTPGLFLAGLFLAGLFLALLLWNCSGEKSESLSGEMQTELAQLPAGFDGLIYTNVKSMKSSPFFKMMIEKHTPNWEKDQEFKQFCEETGFDPLEDIEELYLGFSAPETPREKNALVIVKGNFDVEKLRSYFGKHGQSGPIGDAGYEGYFFDAPNGEAMLLALVDQHRIALGKSALLEKYLTGLKNGNKADNGYAKLVKPVRYKNGAWMSVNTAGMMEKVLDQLDRNPDLPRFPALEHVKYVQWSMKADQELNFDAAGDFGEAEYANLFHDAIKGALAAFKLAVSRDRRVIDVINKIEVKKAGSRVSVHASLNQDDLKKLMAHRPGLARK